MMIALQESITLMKPGAASDLAARLNADPDDDFRYTPVHGPNGMSFVEVADDEGVVGRL